MVTCLLPLSLQGWRRLHINTRPVSSRRVNILPPFVSSMSNRRNSHTPSSGGGSVPPSRDASENPATPTQGADQHRYPEQADPLIYGGANPHGPGQPYHIYQHIPATSAYQHAPVPPQIVRPAAPWPELPLGVPPPPFHPNHDQPNVMQQYNIGLAQGPPQPHLRGHYPAIPDPYMQQPMVPTGPMHANAPQSSHHSMNPYPYPMPLHGQQAHSSVPGTSGQRSWQAEVPGHSSLSGPGPAQMVH